MNALHKKLKDSPLLARILPFLIFIVLTSSQGSFGPESHYWIYLIKTLIGIWMIWKRHNLMKTSLFHPYVHKGGIKAPPPSAVISDW